MTVLSLPFLDGIVEAERSEVTCLRSSETQGRKCPTPAGSQRTIHLATPMILLSVIIAYLISTCEILGFQ